MKERLSTYKLFGIPDAFIVTLLTLGLITAVTPWLPAGTDFGLFKVPTLPYSNELRIVGLVVVIILLLLAFPLWSSEGKLEFVSSNFINKNGIDSIEIKILNSSLSTAYIHSAKIFVKGIYFFEPSSAQIAHVFISYKYDVSLSIKDFPYEISLPLSQAVKSQEADNFAIRVLQDFSFLDSLHDRYNSLLDKYLDTAEDFNGTKIIGVSERTHESAFIEFKENLLDKEKLLLKKLGIVSMNPWGYGVCDILTHFKLDLIYNIDNNESVLKAGEYIYMARQHSGSRYKPISDYNKALYDKFANLDAIKNDIAVDVFKDIKSAIKN